MEELSIWGGFCPALPSPAQGAAGCCGHTAIVPSSPPGYLPVRAELHLTCADVPFVSGFIAVDKKGWLFSHIQTAVGAYTVKNELPAAASASHMKTAAYIFTVLIKHICYSTVEQGIKALYFQFCYQITIHKYLGK